MPPTLPFAPSPAAHELTDEDLRRRWHVRDGLRAAWRRQCPGLATRMIEALVDAGYSPDLARAASDTELLIQRNVGPAVLREVRQALGGPPMRPTIVCLCGSTRFWRAFQAAALRETLAGKIVLSIGAVSETDGEHFGTLPRAEYEAVKRQLDELHLRKVELSDEVLILNCGGYIGESTQRELDHARTLGKRIRWWEPAPADEEGLQSASN